MYQVYNEAVYDLLTSPVLVDDESQANRHGPEGNQLKMRLNKHDQFVVENLQLFETETPEDAIGLFN
jgi:hypothetical protein